MADAVKNIVLSDGQKYYGIHLSNISDGTGESAVIKVDKSTLLASDGAEPASLDIASARWCIQGFTRVTLLWDHTTDDTALVLTGSGYDDFVNGPYSDRTPKGLADPRSSGQTGDILLTTTGAVSGATYDITLWFVKSPD